MRGDGLGKIWGGHVELGLSGMVLVLGFVV